MRWLLVSLGSLATGVLTIVAFLVLLLVTVRVREVLSRGCVKSSRGLGPDFTFRFAFLVLEAGRHRHSTADLRPWLQIGFWVL
jgi:hypothetical protein